MEERICKVCASSQMEDEFHWLLVVLFIVILEQQVFYHIQLYYT